MGALKRTASWVWRRIGQMACFWGSAFALFANNEDSTGERLGAAAVLMAAGLFLRAQMIWRERRT